MSGRGGRGRFRRASRFEDNFGSRNISNKNPPSRHLWVGNLSHATLEHDLSHYFLQFGELESVAFQPGRSYAFINFKREDDAFVAINALQGFPIAGNPLRIEFTKAGVTYVRVCNGLPASDDFAAASKMYLMEIALGTLISKLPAGYMVVRNCCWMLCKLVGNDIEDKPSTPLRDEDYSQHQDEHSASRGSPFSQREFRARHAIPDPFYPEKFNTSDKSMEPSSVLWIGFPALLKVDEMILRKAFSPFGEIEKITAFPGRSYAFVRFRSVVSAFRAKEILQGKLFGNPRVHICFAKSETGSSNGARSSMNVPPSPHSKSDIHLGYSGNLWQDRNFGSLSGDLSIRSQFLPDLDTGDSDAHGFNRKRTSWMGGNNACELARFGDVGSDLGPPHDIYEHRDSSTREGRAPLSDYPEDPWDLSEDVNFFHGAKKLKTGPFPPEKDLPEHPFSDLKQDKHRLPKVFSDFPRHEVFNKNFEAVLHVNKQTPDRTNVAVPHGERSDHWGESYDSFQVGSGSLISKPIEKKRFMPESDQSSLNEWKWEGTIAKGGTPVCRARCFPVGKVLDIMLPEFLDCTARTGLDMLSKHYYQAAKAWVVFFVPESDADMGFYNELMHYLGEKQRAAVAKLDEKTTLFLVPPSDFSEKVLKVPGKLSISGVVLRLEHPGSNFGSIHLQNEKKNTNSLPINSDAPYTKPSTASPPIHPLTSFQDLGKLGVPNASFSGNMVNSAPVGSFSGSAHALNGVSDSYNENRHDYQLNQGNPMSGQNFLSHQLQNSMSGPRDVPSQVSNCAVPVVQEHHSFVPNTGQETSSSHYKGGISGISLSGNGKSFLQETHTSAAFSVAALQPDQLAQLASSLLGQQRQSGSTSHISGGDEFRSTNRPNDSENSLRISQKYVLQNNQVSSELSTSQFGQIQQLQQQQQRTSNVSAVSRMVQGVQGNQLLQNSNTQKEAEADPQKRLQATLQLAAALLQQIQQGKGS